MDGKPIVIANYDTVQILPSVLEPGKINLNIRTGDGKISTWVSPEEWAALNEKAREAFVVSKELMGE